MAENRVTQVSLEVWHTGGTTQARLTQFTVGVLHNGPDATQARVTNFTVEVLRSIALQPDIPPVEGDLVGTDAPDTAEFEGELMAMGGVEENFPWTYIIS
jgi:hypothetical protein